MSDSDHIFNILEDNENTGKNIVLKEVSLKRSKPSGSSKHSEDAVPKKRFKSSNNLMASKSDQSARGARSKCITLAKPSVLSGRSRTLLPVSHSGATAEPGPSTSGAYESDSSRHVSHEVNDSDEFSEPSSPDDLTDLHNLEQSLLEEKSDYVDSDESFFLPILGKNKSSNWNISQSVLSWFSEVADNEITQEKFKEVAEKYSTSPETQLHFSYPKIPEVLWRKVYRNKWEQFQQRSICQAQDYINVALKPLLSAVESMNSKDPNQERISTAIQLLCNSNLTLNRVRRSGVSKYIKPELRPSLFSQRVTHLHLFGDDFDKTAENAAKSEKSLQKVLNYPQRKNLSISKPPARENESGDSAPSTSRTSYPPSKPKKQFFRKRGSFPRSSNRGQGRPKRF